MPRMPMLPLHHKLAAFGLAIAVLLLGGCKSKKPDPLRMGVSDWPGHAPFYAAAKLGFYRSSPVELKGFSSNFDRTLSSL